MKILLCDFMHWVFPKHQSEFNFLKQHGIDVEEVSPTVVSRNTRIFDLPLPKEADPQYKGFNLRNMIKIEIASGLGWYGTNEKIENGWIKRTMAVIDWAIEKFKTEKPNYIVVEGGLTYYARACAEVARELGIATMAIENSFIENKIMVDFKTSFIVNRHLFARCSQDWLDTRILTPEREKEADKIIKDVFKHLTYQTIGDFDFSKLKHKKTVFVPLQVFSDQVTLYDSHFNNETFLLKIVDLAKTVFADWNIILRCHPKEEKWKTGRQTGNWLEKQNLSPNIIIIRGAKYSVNTQELIKHSNLVFVNTSQCGLEACLLEKPVVVFGDAFYAKKGFTAQYTNSINWNKIKETPASIMNLKQAKLWFLYFYKWLYNRKFNDIDKTRIRKELGI